MVRSNEILATGCFFERLKAISIIVILTLSMGIAQQATFTASVDRNTVAAGEQFDISLVISAQEANGIKNFLPPNFGQFVVLSGPNQSTSMQWINGRVSASVTYSYSLYARQPGKYSIGSASVEYKGASLKTQPIQIEVTQGKPQSATGQAQQQGQTAQPALNLADNLFIRAIPDKHRARQGEQITVTYKLYWRVSISSYDLAKAPTYEGFWAENFELPKQPAVTTETYEGKQYQTAAIKKTALFATQSGNLKINPIELRCAVQVQSKRRSNDPFDMFFNDPFFNRAQTVEHEFKSNSLTIAVDPLPPGSPSSFTGAVGSFNFTATLDKKEVHTGDAISLKLSASGTGNVKLLSLPKPDLPADVEAYEPKFSEELSRESGLIRGKKTAEYVLIPRNPGQRTIGPVAFTYFDLTMHQYVTQRSQKFELNILQGREFAAGTNAASKEDIRMLGEDIRFLKLGLGPLLRSEETPFSGGWFLAGLALPPLMFVGAFAYRKRMEKIYGDLPTLRFKKAGREATKRLKYARKLLAQGNTERYHAEITNSLMGYLEDKLQIPKASLTIDEAVSRLLEKGVTSEVAQQLQSCAERAEFARFAPAGDTKSARRDLLDAAAQAINAVEDLLNGQA